MADKFQPHLVEVCDQARIQRQLGLHRAAKLVVADRHHAHQRIVEIDPQMRQGRQQRRRRCEAQVQFGLAREPVAAHLEFEGGRVAHARQQRVLATTQLGEGTFALPRPGTACPGLRQCSFTALRRNRCSRHRGRYGDLGSRCVRGGTGGRHACRGRRTVARGHRQGQQGQQQPAQRGRNAHGRSPGSAAGSAGWDGSGRCGAKLASQRSRRRFQCAGRSRSNGVKSPIRR